MRRARRPLTTLAVLSGLLGTGMAITSAADTPTPLVLTVSIGSAPGDIQLRGVGPGESLQYGTVRLSGQTLIGETPVGVEILGSALYTDGSGPFTGYLTLTYPSGDRLGFAYHADVEATSEQTTIEGSLVTIGGTGDLSEATGTGTVSGARTGPLGSHLDVTLTLEVAGLPDPAEAP